MSGSLGDEYWDGGLAECSWRGEAGSAPGFQPGSERQGVEKIFHFDVIPNGHAVSERHLLCA